MQVHPPKVSIRKPNQQQPMKMKPYQKIAALAAVFSLGLVGSIYAEDKHDHGDHDGHDHGKHAKKIAGPNGGRVLTGVEPHLEFFLTKDRLTMMAKRSSSANSPLRSQAVVARTQLD
jgi:hypothetical protein